MEIMCQHRPLAPSVSSVLNLVVLSFVYLHLCLKKTYALVPYLENVRRCPFRAFYDVSRSEGHCRACQICPKGYQIMEPCTDTNDTVCEQCAPGTYNDVIGGMCTTCTSCVAGEFVRRHCRSHRDTKCRRCPRYTFSSRENVGVCRYCRQCNEYEEEVLPCKRNHDRVCGGCRKGYFRLYGGGCLKCSLCHSNASAVVRECEDQELDDPGHVCWPVTVNSETEQTQEEGLVSNDTRLGEESDVWSGFYSRLSIVIVVLPASFAVLTFLMCSLFTLFKTDFYVEPPFVNCFQ